MKTAPLFVLCALTIAVPSAWAYWVQDGAAICAATGDQLGTAVVSDGAGGSIVVWMDYRSGNWDIYARRVTASGTFQWTTDGVAVCTATGDQSAPMIISDGAGGAIITWYDYRSATNYDIYAQRVNASGAVQWTANGIALCTAAGNQNNPQITSDGAGGAIVTWHDTRSGNYDIYAQRVNASGTVQWPANGWPVCMAAGDQYYPMIVSDGAGGIVVTWQDGRSVSAWDIYAQRLNANGTALWTTDGVALSTAAGHQWYPTIISDGAGGAIVGWMDSRSGNYDVYAQRVNASGSVLWTANGAPVCTASGDQYPPWIVPDGAGGVIATWQDYRGGNWDIHAQRMNASGAAVWAANGIVLCSASGIQQNPQIISDGAGGTFVTWEDLRTGTADIYAQRVNASGAVQWTADGLALCAATGSQQVPQIASDGAGGAIVTWYDYRAGYNSDIYAQSIDVRGRTGFLAPSIYSVRDVPGDQGGKVYLSWYGARSDVFMDGQMSYYSIWRAINPVKAALALESGASSLDDLSKLDLSSGKPVIRIEQAAGRTFFWELIQTVSASYMPGYGKPVVTLFDSTAVSKEYHFFQVIAHTNTPTVFWKSEPDSGRSVDNLPPGTPVALAGQQSFTPVGLKLTWDRNTDADLGAYHVYRGLTGSFVPGPSNLVASPNDTTLLDGGWRWSSGYYYKVSAIDIHGNESGFALLTPDGVTGTDTPKAPEASYLAQNYPNPFNPTTRITFGLSAPGHVSLKIYDAAGRLVRALVSNERQAARYVETWDGLDSSGRAVASGIYFYRLDSGAFTETKKMALTR
jgi:hypothetical protein